MSRMYENVKSWNVHVGCEFNCIYCYPSFRRQAKRLKHKCEKCYNYEPHFHPERLERLPSSKTIFACAMGDIAFASPDNVRKIFDVIKKHRDRQFYIQSKNPSIFHEWLKQLSLEIPENVILGTTIETNRIAFDVKLSKYALYYEISRAPPPYKRYLLMRDLEYPRKYVTIEPILDFDFEVLVHWIKTIGPEFVYVGYDNHNYKLPEPPVKKTKELIEELRKFTEVRLKTIRLAWWEQDGSI